MPTDKERREVARKLKSWEWKAVSPKCLLNSLVFDDECPGTDDDPDTITCQECERMAARRLADLIEPAKTGPGSLSGVCPKCGGSTYVVCDDYDWWVITCDVCGAVRGFNPGNYIPYGEIEREWKEDVNAD